MAQGILDGAEHLEELGKIDQQVLQVCRETDIGEAQSKYFIKSWTFRRTLLKIITAQVARHKEMKELLEEFRLPIVRMEQNLEVLRDGLEGKNDSFFRGCRELTSHSSPRNEAGTNLQLGIQYSVFPLSPDCRNRSKRGNMSMAA